MQAQLQIEALQSQAMQGLAALQKLKAGAPQDVATQDLNAAGEQPQNELPGGISSCSAAGGDGVDRPDSASVEQLLALQSQATAALAALEQLQSSVVAEAAEAAGLVQPSSV